MAEENGVIEIFLTDGSSKGFYISSVQTTNAVKYLISKRLGLDQSEWQNFGLFVLVNNKKIQPLTDEHPLHLHLMWGEDSGNKYKFLFKRNTTTLKEKAIESKSFGTWFGSIVPKKMVNKSVTPTPPTIRTPRVHFDDEQTKNHSPPVSPGGMLTSTTIPTSSPMVTMSSSSVPPPVSVSTPSTTTVSTPVSTLSSASAPTIVSATPVSSQGQLTDTESQSEPDLENFQAQNTQVSMLVGFLGKDNSNPQQGPTFLEKDNSTLQQQELTKAKDRSKCSQTLLNWVNMKILPRKVKITNLSSDFQDGVIFWVLLETLLERNLKGWHQTPNSLLHKLDNLSLFLHTLGNLGIKLIGVNAEDLYGSNNEDLVTVILVALIKQYQEQRTRTSSMANVLMKHENRSFTKFHLKGVDNANPNPLPKSNTLQKSISNPSIKNIRPATFATLSNQTTKSDPSLEFLSSDREIPPTFTINFMFDNTKKKILLTSERKTKTLREILTNLCLLRHWNIDDCVVRNKGGNVVDIEMMMGDISVDEVILEPKIEKNTEASSDFELGDDLHNVTENSDSTEVSTFTQDLHTSTPADVQPLMEDPTPKPSGPKSWPINDIPSTKPRLPNSLLTGLHKITSMVPDDLGNSDPSTEFSPDSLDMRGNTTHRGISFVPWTSPRVTEEPRNTFLANSRNQPYFLQPSLQKRRTVGTGLGSTKETTTVVDQGSESEELDTPPVMEIDLTVSVPGTSNYEKKNQSIDLGDINQLLDMLIAELNE